MTEQSSAVTSPEAFDALYRGQGMETGHDEIRMNVIPWQLDGPQPLVVELADAGEVAGPVLECGCGLGDNAIFLAERGYSVTAFDVSATVIDQDRAKAAARGAAVTFVVADATVLDGIDGSFQTVLDCAMLHCLTDEQRRSYLAALRQVCQPGARLHILCFPEMPGAIPLPGHRDEASLRRDLSEHWDVERMELRHYTSSMSRDSWREILTPAVTEFLGDIDSPDRVDDQGRVLLPIWQITARLR